MMDDKQSFSYLFGSNAPYIEELYENYLNDPNSVDEHWKQYFTQLAAQPGAVERDIALVVSESVTHAVLLQAIELAAVGGVLRQATLFDVYRPKPGQDNAAVGAGEKSLAVRLVFNKDEATLTEEEIDAAVSAVLAAAHERLGARLRA